MMDFEEIKQILALVKEHELAEFELTHQDFRIRIRKDGAPTPVAPLPTAVAPALAAPIPAAASGVPPAAAAPTVEDGDELAMVTSPIVGTFYEASEPGAKAFASVGDVVRKGQVLCIIEAMKLMNEIESEYDGEIVKAYVDNGKPVQYGERLFAIRVK
jgi:acetyl-CoA carboxylase biotin carboxyl carrier protein